MDQKEEPTEISREKEMSARALSRDMFLLDQAMYRQDAREEGRKEGFAEAFEEGREEIRREYMHILYTKGYSLAELSEVFQRPISVIEQYLSSKKN